jgi:hypothetical protein
MPRLAENPLVKKEMTKVKSCTKKYRKAVRNYYKASATLSKHRGTAKRRETLYKKTKKANEKADEIKDQCDGHRVILSSMVRAGKVVKEETKTQIQNLFDKLSKDEMEWSSNNSRDLSAMQ